MSLAAPARAGLRGESFVVGSLSCDESARHARMLTSMMAAYDPCGWIEAGGSPSLYTANALEMLRVLRERGDIAALIMLFPNAGTVAAAASFATVALDWWSRT